MSTLYIVATPIGNLDDLTLRAVSILREVPVVIAEDTRVTRKLLDHIGASPSVVRFDRHSKEGDTARVLSALDDGDVALVTDAGTPGVNDPGQKIVTAAAERGHKIVPLPGPSAIMAALSVSGFYADQFVSYGFLPPRGSKRRNLLKEIARQPIAAVFFETPHRLKRALDDMVNTLGDRRLVVCREMTKMYEEIWRGTAADALQHFENPRGEFVIVVAPLEPSYTYSNFDESIDIEQRILTVASELEGQHDTRRDLVAAVAKQTGIPKRDVYQTLHRET